MILDRSGCVGLIHTKEVVASGGVVGQVLLQALSDVVLGDAIMAIEDRWWKEIFSLDEWRCGDSTKIATLVTIPVNLSC